MLRAVLLFVVSLLISLMICVMLANDDFYSIASLYLCIALFIYTVALATRLDSRRHPLKAVFLVAGGLLIVMYALMYLFVQLGIVIPFFHGDRSYSLLESRLLPFIALYFSALSLGLSVSSPKKKVVVVKRRNPHMERAKSQDECDPAKGEVCELS